MCECTLVVLLVKTYCETYCVVTQVQKRIKTKNILLQLLRSHIVLAEVDIGTQSVRFHRFYRQAGTTHVLQSF